MQRGSVVRIHLKDNKYKNIDYNLEILEVVTDTEEIEVFMTDDRGRKVPYIFYKPLSRKGENCVKWFLDTDVKTYLIAGDELNIIAGVPSGKRGITTLRNSTTLILSLITSLFSRFIIEKKGGEFIPA